MVNQPPSNAGSDSATLILAPADGATLQSFRLSASDGPAMLGRSRRCRISLQGPAHSEEDLLLSREHALFEHRAGRWFITDLSRHGTFLNGVRLQPNVPTALNHRDVVRAGQWSFNVRLEKDADCDNFDSRATVDFGTEASRLRRVRIEELGDLARRRLDLLLDCAERTTQVESDDDLNHLILTTAIEGSGFARAVLLHTSETAHEVTVLASSNCSAALQFSRSLLRAAREGDVAVLSPEAADDRAVSIVDLGIHHALCAPVMIDGAVDWLLYLDSRGGEHGAQPDAAAFCDGLARIAGHARGNLHRQKLREEQQAMQRDLRVAQEIQTRLLPPTQGEMSGFRYAMRLAPGRHVSGDLFDVMPLSGSSIAICLGDVSGGGVGPGLIMGVTLAHLRAALSRSQDLERAVSDLNTYLCAHLPSGVFVSLWIAIFDAREIDVRYIDAGHGHWMHLRNGTMLVRGETAGPPLGIDASQHYAAAARSFQPTDRLILYSDGVSECHRRHEGDLEFFGRGGIEKVVAGSHSAAEDVERIFEAVLAFSDSTGLTDDTTAASIERVLPGADNPRASRNPL